ncbi:phosphatidylglycerol lysyltransferase domain-containing protein [Saccharibacillus endophyticus]|uniref:Phosphatidylglycerol lysyltransferase C-terminal domain-containing protein n=1 Tax=Saccharibacillus endophyticus TaxID=2060666 RepID=A0ABQ1ZZ68_9BACL|nr:phosphatidylglycerol lysyltransferase domain-containing protein [Saccharibacillus endophyticus]GGH80805.1 hypothetical protein GCM10007362_29680 [Saccharibacillus endophyticus]
MHRKLNAMTGVMEHAIISAAMKLKEDNVNKLSLGIAPLAGIEVTEKDLSKAEKLMNAVFHNMSFGYNFKNLYRFKKKFDPTAWTPRYLIYDSDISLMELAISIAHTKRGATDLTLYAKYKLFFIKYSLGFYEIRNN